MTRTIIFAAVLAILGLFLVFANISLRRERNELKTALNASQERLEELRSDIKRQATALAEREISINKLTADKNRLNKKLREVAEHEQEVKLWIDTVVPPAVSGLLRGEQSTGDNPSPVAASMQ